jgi:hypothetical protein
MNKRLNITTSISGALVLGLGALTLGCSGPANDSGLGNDDTEDKGAKLAPFDDAARKAYLHDATLWSSTNIETMDLVNGPGGAGSFTPIQPITCTFHEPASQDEVPGGATPKFLCDIKDGDSVNTVKVKYEQGNGELYGEMIGSRLFWALGFGSDDMYSIHATCENCPKDDPWSVTKSLMFSGPGIERVFDPADTERKFAGTKMVAQNVDANHEGWSFSEVDKIKADLTGDPKTQWDGFKLLAAFIKHIDSKMPNQRLVCLKGGIDGSGHCTKPFMLIQDFGATFGEGKKAVCLVGATVTPNSKARMQSWMGAKVWEDPNACVAHQDTCYTLNNPKTSPEGKAFVSGLLHRLSPQQLLDLFTAARVELHNEKVSVSTLKSLFPTEDFSDDRLMTLFPGEDPHSDHVVNAAVWVMAFNAKLAELDSGCPMPTN